MTLSILPEHHIAHMDQSPAVAHIHFRDESGMLRFIADNAANIRSKFERWTADWTPMLTVTASR